MAEQEEMFETDEVVAAESGLDSIFEEKSSVVSFVGERYKRAVDLGASTMGTEQMVGVGEQKASAAVEYEDELRAIHSALGLYARSE